MTEINQIKSPVVNELSEYREVFDQAFVAPDDLLQKVLAYVHEKRGKQLRPILVLLAAKLCGKITAETYKAAAAFEILHNASLMHDDVVDETKERRGKYSVNASFSNKAAILVGDYLLTKAMELIVETKNLDLQSCFCEISSGITRGELLEMQQAHSVPSEPDYYTMIGAKTAILFAVCAKAGAITAQADEMIQKMLTDFGNYLGICFQIKDDIFDYSDNQDIGKPTLNDIREGKVTLPLIFTLREADGNEKNRILEILDNQDFTSENITYAAQLVEKYHGVDYAIRQMNYFREKAVDTLISFPESETKKALFLMLDFVLDRNK